MSRVLLISSSHEYEVRLQRLLGGSLSTVVGGSLATGEDITLEAATAGEPEVVLLGPYLPYDGAAELCAELRDRYKGVSLVLVHENSAALEDLVVELRAEAVINPAAEDGTVLEVLSALSSTPLELPAMEEPDEALHVAPVAGFGGDPEPARASGRSIPDALAPIGFSNPSYSDSTEAARVITVVAPKGGVGKTTIASNLALGLAALAPDAVVLVDADMQFGDVANVLDLTPAHALPDLVTGPAVKDAMVLKTLLTRHPGGFYVVCGALSPAEGEQVTGPQLSHLLEQLSGTFKYVVIDTTPGLGEHALAALDLTTDMVAMCSLAVPSLRALRTELSVLSDIGLVPHASHVVLNLVDTSSGLTAKDASAILGVDVDVAIPRSKTVPLSTNRGVPILKDAPRDPAARAMANLVTRLAGVHDMPAARRPGRKSVA